MVKPELWIIAGVKSMLKWSFEAQTEENDYRVNDISLRGFAATKTLYREIYMGCIFGSKSAACRLEFNICAKQTKDIKNSLFIT